MNKKNVKNIVAMLLCIATVFSSFTMVYAGTVPASYDKDEYKTNGTVDYKKIHAALFFTKGARVPEAKFEVHVKSGANNYVYKSDEHKEIDVYIGDTLNIVNTSDLGSGDDFEKCDFQVSDSKGISQTTSLGLIEDYFNAKVKTDKQETYRIYLNIMDNEDISNTEGWGNWAYNGSYSVIGQNPVGGTASSFDCWWYYANMTIKVEPYPPTADFKVYYQDDDVTDNKDDAATIDPGDMSLALEDCSTPFSAAEPITNRKWSYWDVYNGWKEIAGSANKTTVNISHMDSNLPGSGINKAFKLDVASSGGGEDYAEHTAYFKKVLTSGYIVYYRDIDTDRDIYPAKEMPGLSFGTYTEYARPAPKNSELITPSPTTITLDEDTPFAEFIFYYNFTAPPSNEPPTAILETPEEVMAGEVVRADGSKSWSNNPGGYIADYYFEYEGANLESDNGSNVRIWYPAIGTYQINLEVEDEKGKHDSMENEITVTPPVPTAVISITGKLKENRKVTISSSRSTSPKYYPVDVTNTTWTIAPVSVGTAEDIKYHGSLTGSATKNILFKKAGTYKIDLTVKNTYGRTASASQTITIDPDLPPVAKIQFPVPEGIPYRTYRDPDNNNYAAFELFNESYSTDGDIIDKGVMMYCYDSDNNGSYIDEQWYCSKDGTSWQPSGMDYFDMVMSNPPKFTLITREVGKYRFGIRVKETIPEEETITEFIDEGDYKCDDSFADNYAGETCNVAPAISLSATPAKKPVDIVILTDYTGTKLAALNTQINALKANFASVNVDPVFHVVNDVKNIGTQVDQLYWYRRYGRFSCVSSYHEWWSNWDQKGGKVNQKIEETVLWEQIQGLTGQYSNLPKRNPTNISYTKSAILSKPVYIDGTPYDDYYYDINIYCSNDVKTSGTISVDWGNNQRKADHYESYGSMSQESVSVDSRWNREEKISDVSYPIYSLDFSKLNTLSLRPDSDRHMIFLSDATSKNYGAGKGNYFSFGDMTDSLKNYIAANAFELYGVVPNETKDMTLLSDKVSRIQPLGQTTLFYMNSGDIMKLGDPILAGMIGSGEKMFPEPTYDIGGIKEIFDSYSSTYYFRDNGLVSYIYKGTNNIVNVLSGITKVVQANNAYLYAIHNNGNVYKINMQNYTVESLSNPFFCEKVVPLGSSDCLFIDSNGTPYFRQVYIYSSHEYYFFERARIRNTQNAALSYLGTIKDAESYVPAGGSYRSAITLVQYYSDMVQQFVGVTSERVESGSYVYYYQELVYDPSCPINELNVDRIENSNKSIFIFKKDGSVKMHATDYKYTGNRDEGYYWYPIPRNYLVSTPLSNIKDIYKTKSKYFFITDNNDVTYFYNPIVPNTTPVIGSNLINIGSGVKEICETEYTSWQYKYIYVLYKDGTVRNIKLRYSDIYTNTLYGNTMLPYTNIKNIYSSVNNIYLVSDNGSVLGAGDTSYGQLGYKGYWVDTFVNPFSTTLYYDTAKTYLSLLDIFRSVTKSEFFAAGQYTAAFDKIYGNYRNNGDGKVYVILGEDIEYKSTYSDYENDPEYCRRWSISHDPGYFDNSMGLSVYHNPTGFMEDPPQKLDKVGKYIINLKARDNPKNDLRFMSDSNEDKNYYKWNLGEQNLTAYVHRRPIARQRITIEDNGNETYTVKAYDAGSYDPDHSSSRADKGIAYHEWRWRDDSQMVWHYEQMDKSDCDPQKAYTLQLRVRDLEGAWSDYNTIEIANNPPIALFTLEKNPIFDNEVLLAKDQSVSQSFASLVKWHWIVKKYNEGGTLPDTDIQNEKFSNCNDGRGELEGYDINVKTDYSDTGAGRYRLYLRVRDSNGMWSDEGTDSTYNLSNMYYEDLEVQESFKMTDFRVVLIRDFHLESYYNVNGSFPDRPMYVNSMAIDTDSFMTGGYSDVPGFSGLSKGYLFEFEIDTINFNEDNDTVEIEPAFHAYYGGIPSIRGPESDLYWEDSNKELHKAGEGGHRDWARIILDSSKRTVTGENTGIWRGKYLIPATSWLVTPGTPGDNAKTNRINADIIVNFAIKGYRGGTEKYDYNQKQWPMERTEIKYPYEIGDVIRYDHTKSSLEDIEVIINRP